MKIVFVLDGFEIGGTELNAVRTLEAFARRDFAVTVLHFKDDGPLKQRMDAIGHEMVHCRTAGFHSPLLPLRFASIVRELRRLRPSVIHTQMIYGNIFCAAAGMLIGRPVITSRRWKDKVPRRAMIPMNAWAHRHSALVLPNASALTGLLLKEGVGPARIEVHQNFIDDSSLRLLPATERASWRASLGLPADAIAIGCVARFTTEKRHDVLIDAFRIVADQVPQARLVLVGYGSEQARLEERVRGLSLDGRVFFTGLLPHAPLASQLFDIACLASDNEGFPNSIVEASACGVPIIATLVGGTPDVLIEGVTGLGIAVADVEGTAAAMQSLAVNPELRQRYGEAGRDLVIERFSETAAIDRLIGIYRRVAEQHPVNDAD